MYDLKFYLHLKWYFPQNKVSNNLHLLLRFHFASCEFDVGYFNKSIIIQMNWKYLTNNKRMANNILRNLPLTSRVAVHFYLILLCPGISFQFIFHTLPAIFLILYHRFFFSLNFQSKNFGLVKVFLLRLLVNLRSV